MNRRKFLKNTLLASLASVFTPTVSKSMISNNSSFLAKSKPIIISTWDHGLKANEAAWSIIKGGGRYHYTFASPRREKIYILWSK